MTDVQTQMSGGVRWLGHYCSEQFDKGFSGIQPGTTDPSAGQAGLCKESASGTGASARSSSWYVALLAMDFISARSAFKKYGTRIIPSSPSGARALTPSTAYNRYCAVDTDPD